MKNNDKNYPFYMNSYFESKNYSTYSMSNKVIDDYNDNIVYSQCQHENNIINIINIRIIDIYMKDQRKKDGGMWIDKWLIPIVVATVGGVLAGIVLLLLHK